jgi:hypothetical protein
MPVRVLTNADTRPHTCANKMERFLYTIEKLIHLQYATAYKKHDCY